MQILFASSPPSLYFSLFFKLSASLFKCYFYYIVTGSILCCFFFIVCTLIPKRRNFDEQSKHSLMTHTFFFFPWLNMYCAYARYVWEKLYTSIRSTYPHTNTRRQANTVTYDKSVMLCVLFDLFLKVSFEFQNNLSQLCVHFQVVFSSFWSLFGQQRIRSFFVCVLSASVIPHPNCYVFGFNTVIKLRLTRDREIAGVTSEWLHLIVPLEWSSTINRWFANCNKNNGKQWIQA